MNIERRAFPLTEIRMIEEENTPKITGYAAVFNQLSNNLGGFREQIAPGAFSKTLQTADVRALWNHDANYVLGRNKSGTLMLQEDQRGLKIEIIPPETQWAKDLITSMKRGDVDQMSFGFRTIKDDWETRGNENIRTLKEVELFDVSIVTYPAYPQTEVQARSLILEAGFNIDDLTRIVTRAENGLSLTKEDRDIAHQWIELLQKYIAELGQEPHSATEIKPKQARKLDDLWKKLKEVDQAI